MASFEIEFKVNKSDPKTAEKTFDPDKKYKKNCTPYEALDDLNGFVIIDYDPNVMACNYAEYDSKQYFITDRIRQPGHKLQIRLRIDSLSTYWTQIKECNAMVNTTTDDKGWTEMIQGDRLIYAYGINHATQTGNRPSLDYDPGHFYMAIYG